MNTVTVELRDDLAHQERQILDEIKALGGVRTDQDVVRVAIWKLAAHFDIAMPPDAFALPYRPTVGAEALHREPLTLPLLEETADAT